MNDRQKRDLDNYITGHGGEDQFRNLGPCTHRLLTVTGKNSFGQGTAECDDCGQAMIHRPRSDSDDFIPLDDSLLCTDNSDLTAEQHLVLIEDMTCPYCGKGDV